MNPRLLPLLALLAGPAALAQPSAALPGEPRVERRVVEDDHVRVEELKVRGETRRVVVTPKSPHAREYEILTPVGASDPSQRRSVNAGERVWRLMSF